MATARGWRLRRAIHEDLAQMVASGLTTPVTSWSEEDYRSELSVEGSQTWVIEESGIEPRASGLLGTLVYRVLGPEIELMHVAVAPGARRLGLGGQLMKHLVGEARASGGECVHLEVRADNVAALALYVQCGFAVVGRRTRYYRDGADALLMDLKLC